MSQLSQIDQTIYNKATNAESRIRLRKVPTKKQKEAERKVQLRRQEADDLQRNPVFTLLIDGLEHLLAEETNKMRKTMPSGLHKQQGVASGVELSLNFIKTKLLNTPKPELSTR